MHSPHAVHDAAAEASRRQRLRSSGIPAQATVLAVRRLDVLDSGVSLLELDLRVSVTVDGVARVRTLTTAEPISLVLAAQARPGASLDVFVSRSVADGVVIEWSG
jgi:hypothetical protein